MADHYASLASEDDGFGPDSDFDDDDDDSMPELEPLPTAAPAIAASTTNTGRSPSSSTDRGGGKAAAVKTPTPPASSAAKAKTKAAVVTPASSRSSSTSSSTSVSLIIPTMHSPYRPAPPIASGIGGGAVAANDDSDDEDSDDDDMPALESISSSAAFAKTSSAAAAGGVSTAAPSSSSAPTTAAAATTTAAATIVANPPPSFHPGVGTFIANGLGSLSASGSGGNRKNKTNGNNRRIVKARRPPSTSLNMSPESAARAVAALERSSSPSTSSTTAAASTSTIDASAAAAAAAAAAGGGGGGRTSRATNGSCSSSKKPFSFSPSSSSAGVASATAGTAAAAPPSASSPSSSSTTRPKEAMRVALQAKALEAAEKSKGSKLTFGETMSVMSQVDDDDDDDAKRLVAESTTRGGRGGGGGGVPKTMSIVQEVDSEGNVVSTHKVVGDEDGTAKAKATKEKEQDDGEDKKEDDDEGRSSSKANENPFSALMDDDDSDDDDDDNSDEEDEDDDDEDDDEDNDDDDDDPMDHVNRMMARAMFMSMMRDIHEVVDQVPTGGGGGGGSSRAGRPPFSFSLGNDDNDDDSDDDDDSLPPLESIPLSSSATLSSTASGNTNDKEKEVQKDEDDEEDDDDDDDDDDDEGATCAICFRGENTKRSSANGEKWRKFVKLPCCGTKGREATSTTRFCAGCILQLALKSGGGPGGDTQPDEYRSWEDERNETPASYFYRASDESNDGGGGRGINWHKRIVECPRCRDLVCVHLRTKSSSSGDSDNDSDDDDDCDCSDCRLSRRRAPPTIETTSKFLLKRPTFRAAATFVGRKRGFAPILYSAAHLHKDFVPLELLGGDYARAKVLRLCRWGMLRPVPPPASPTVRTWANRLGGARSDDVFAIDADKQRVLRELCTRASRDDDDDDDGEESKDDTACMIALNSKMTEVAWKSLKKGRVVTSIRLVNRIIYLVTYSNGFLPGPPLPRCQEWVATSLSVFVITMMIQFALIAVVYGATFFGVVTFVGSSLKASGRKSIWWRIAVVALLVCVAGRVGTISGAVGLHLGLVRPVALLPGKVLFN